MKTFYKVIERTEAILYKNEIDASKNEIHNTEWHSNEADAIQDFEERVAVNRCVTNMMPKGAAVVSEVKTENFYSLYVKNFDNRDSYKASVSLETYEGIEKD